MTTPSLKKILVVDDEQEALTHLTNILKRANYQVISTTKGKEAVDLSLKLKPDLIILDILLPDLEGSQVASTLKENSSTSGIPIIFLTGMLSKKEEEFLGGKRGRDYVLAKPVTQEELLGLVSKVLVSLME